jgi:hypothetical protein
MFCARFARTKGGEVVHFSALPKNEPHSPSSCERSEHEMLKTGLGYAHPSIIYFNENTLATPIIGVICKISKFVAQ